MNDLLDFLKSILEKVEELGDVLKKNPESLQSIINEFSKYETEKFSISVPASVCVKGEELQAQTLKEKWQTLALFDQKLKSITNDFANFIDSLPANLDRDIFGKFQAIYKQLSDAEKESNEKIKAYQENAEIKKFKESIIQAAIADEIPKGPTIIIRLWRRPGGFKIAGFDSTGHLTIQVFNPPEEDKYISTYQDLNRDPKSQAPIDSPHLTFNKKTIDFLARYGHMPKNKTVAGRNEKLEDDYERLLFGKYYHGHFSHYVECEKISIDCGELYRLNIEEMYKKAEEKSKNKKFNFYFNNCAKPVFEVLQSGEAEKFYKFPFSIPGLIDVKSPQLVFLYVKKLEQKISNLNKPVRAYLAEKGEENKIEEKENLIELLEQTVDALHFLIKNNDNEENTHTDISKKTNDCILNIQERLVRFTFYINEYNFLEKKEEIKKYIEDEIEKIKILNGEEIIKKLNGITAFFVPKNGFYQILKFHETNIRNNFNSDLINKFKFQNKKNMTELYRLENPDLKLPHECQLFTDADILFYANLFLNRGRSFSSDKESEFVNFSRKIIDFLMEKIKNGHDLNEVSIEFLNKKNKDISNLINLNSIFNDLYAVFNDDNFFEKIKDENAKSFIKSTRFKCAIQSVSKLLIEEYEKNEKDDVLINWCENSIKTMRDGLGFLQKHIYFDLDEEKIFLKKIKTLFPILKNCQVNSIDGLLKLISDSFIQKPLNIYKEKPTESEAKKKLFNIFNDDSLVPHAKFENMKNIIAVYKPSVWKFWRHGEYKRYQEMEQDAYKACMLLAFTKGYIDEIGFYKIINAMRENLPKKNPVRGSLKEIMDLLKNNYIKNEEKANQFVSEEETLRERHKQALKNSYERLKKCAPVKKQILQGQQGVYVKKISDMLELKIKDLDQRKADKKPVNCDEILEIADNMFEMKCRL